MLHKLRQRAQDEKGFTLIEQAEDAEDADDEDEGRHQHLDEREALLAAQRVTRGQGA